MIQANELRIGNYIYSLLTQKYIKVHSRFFRLIESEIRVKGDSTYAGIPLTEELLLKCGFISYSNGYLSENDSMYLKKFNGDFYYEMKHIIKYIHELQNWYYLINAGTELEINL